MRKALYKLPLHLFSHIFPVLSSLSLCLPQACAKGLQVCCQTCDVIAGVLESWRRRQSRSSTSSIFLCAQEEQFNVSHSAGPQEQSCRAVVEQWLSAGQGPGKLWLRKFSTLGCILQDLSKCWSIQSRRMEKTHRKAFQNTGVHEKCHCVVHAVLYGDTQAG